MDPYRAYIRDGETLSVHNATRRFVLGEHVSFAAADDVLEEEGYARTGRWIMLDAPTSVIVYAADVRRTNSAAAHRSRPHVPPAATDLDTLPPVNRAAMIAISAISGSEPYRTPEGAVDLDGLSYLTSLTTNEEALIDLARAVLTGDHAFNIGHMIRYSPDVHMIAAIRALAATRRINLDARLAPIAATPNGSHQ